jgi:hypothetical protein
MRMSKKAAMAPMIPSRMAAIPSTITLRQDPIVSHMAAICWILLDWSGQESTKHSDGRTYAGYDGAHFECLYFGMFLLGVRVVLRAR